MTTVDCGFATGLRIGEPGSLGDLGEPGSLGDLGELYRALSKRLERIVRFDVRAPESLIEEACQSAWSRLVYHQHRVRREAALSWLAATAVHEALKLIRRGRRELPLDAVVRGRELRSLPIDPGPAELLEQRDRLAALGSLPRRQQRVLWLRALGLSHEEIALHDGCTARTVERQLGRARSTLRAAGG